MKTTPQRPNITERLSAKAMFDGVVGQDGAIWGDLLFRFETDGVCTVYSLTEKKAVADFTLDKAELYKPHSNTVCFGAQRVDEADEFPLLYCNVYNNYSNEADRREGQCCVYRITRDGSSFSTTLVQIIKIGFVDDLTMWKSLPDNGDRRPYGNFVPDVTRGKLYAYVMRDANLTTRCFVFDLPRLGSGKRCPVCGAEVVTLGKDDICKYFDYAYSFIIQGGCAYDGLLYSLEGGTATSPDSKWLPKLKVVDVDKECLIAEINLYAHGLSIEPEMIDFADGTLYYMNSSGAVYTLDFC